MKYIRITISILLMLSLMACIYMRPTSNSELSENEVLVYSFYSWYIESIKMSAEDFKPIFVESSDGMTILDFLRYVKNLKKYHFSEELVQAEIGSYSQCAESLKNVKYADFRVNRFSDLDEYENMGCDFGNGLRWLGGNEVCDGIEIVEILQINPSEITVKIRKFNSSNNTERFYWQNHIKIHLLKNHSVWEIDDINILQGTKLQHNKRL